MGDVIVLLLLAGAVGLALRSLRKHRKQGGCTGCSQCQGGCPGCRSTEKK